MNPTDSLNASTLQDPRAANWGTQQLAEFVATVTRAPDEQQALDRACELIAEALEADVVALADPEGVIVACSGYPRDQAPLAEISEVIAGGRDRLEIAGIGPAEAICVRIEADALDAMVVARSGVQLSVAERSVIRGAGRVTAITVGMLRLLAAEKRSRIASERQSRENAALLSELRERQRLLERLSRIQSSIVSRAGLDEVLDRVVRGASELLGDELVALRLIDPDDPGTASIVAAAGISPEVIEEQRTVRIGQGIGGRAISEGRLVVSEDYGHDGQALPAWRRQGLTAAMAAPVREHGDVVGSLVVATTIAGRTFSKAEREALVAFAEHVSLALTDSRTVNDALHQALHDSLTDLPNRTLLNDRLEQAVARSKRGDTLVGVMFVDLDSFKSINDSLGHVIGDELLCGVADRLRGVLRPADTAARFGGDEFVIVLEDVDEARCRVVAERILASLREPFELGGNEVFLGASIGIAIGGDDPAGLIRNADVALYGAKGRGRERIEVFAPEVHHRIVERLELQVELQRALRSGAFVVHYQPIVKLGTGELAAVEALVRWNHPERGLLPPGVFIEAAEDSHAIVGIGRIVLEEACRQLAEWRSEYCLASALAVTVNLSNLQLNEQGLVDEVAAVLEQTGIDPASLVLELTETAFMGDPELIAERLRELKALGVNLAVDDFGTGYSSLSHLRSFPIDVLKIAKSFVDEIGGGSEQPALARAIVDLGGSFQLRVVAEGIEHAEQYRRLHEMGCELGQGFLFARPGPASEISEMLASGALIPLGGPSPAG